MPVYHAHLREWFLDSEMTWKLMQAAPKKGSGKGAAKGKRAKRGKFKADSRSGGSSEEESDFEAPAHSRPAAPSGRVTRSQPASLQAETIPAQGTLTEPLTG